MTHYKLIEFLSVFRMSSLPAQTQSTPYWKLSGDGSGPSYQQTFVGSLLNAKIFSRLRFV